MTFLRYAAWRPTTRRCALRLLSACCQYLKKKPATSAFRDKFRAEPKTIANDVIEQIENYDFDSLTGPVLITSYVVE